MDFLLLGQILEAVKDDLGDGCIGDAAEKLGEVVRINPGEYYGYGATHSSTRKAAAKMVESVRRRLREDGPSPGSIRSPQQPGKKLEDPLKVKFKSLLRGWKEHRESGGEDSPEALGGFLHRHFGHKNFNHEKVMKIAMKAHGKDKDTARRVADHYIAMNRGRNPPPTR